MGDRKLSHLLIDFEFFSALGTIEGSGLNSFKPSLTKMVMSGKPFTTDYNNGVRVIYDEMGRPWIAHSTGVEWTVDIMESYGYKLTPGAYVPHSNDGGHFVRNVIPNLINRF